MRVGSVSILGIVLGFACTRGIELGSDRGGASGGSGGVGAAGAGACQVTRCENRVFACGDCLDDDGDGLVDTNDPECFGPCDDSEESYQSSAFGQSDATCKIDCYFDNDNGSGNDDCHWSHRCDPGSVAPDFPPSGDNQCDYAPTATVPGSSLRCEELQAAQSSACLATCLPLTPPGCDCFGCCEWPLGSGRAIWLGSSVNGAGSCDAASLDDPTRCRPCMRVLACSKD